MPLIIVLSKNNQVIGINQYEINEFLSLDSRQVKITWVGNIGQPDKIDVLPDVNIMDQSVYLKS